MPEAVPKPGVLRSMSMKAVTAAQDTSDFIMKHPALFSLLILPALACDAQEGPSYPGEPIAEVRGSLVADADAPNEAQAAILWFTSDDADCSGPTLECSMGFSVPAGEGELALSCAGACEATSCEPDALAVWTECVEACGADIEASADAEFAGCATGGVGEAVALTVDSFPAEFELALFDTPPAEALLRGGDGGPRVAMGVFVALSSEAPAVFDFSDDNETFASVIGGVESHALIYAVDPIPADSGWGQYLGGAYDTGYHLVRYEAEIDCDVFPGECVIEEETRAPEPRGFDVEVELKFAPFHELFLPV